MTGLARPGQTGSTCRCVNHLIITGGSGGLGQAVIDAFTAPDWQVLAPRHSELDLNDTQAIHEYLKTSPVDLLIAAAGLIRDAPLARFSEEAWEEVISVNYRAAAACAAAVLPTMIEQRRGHLVFISSFSAIHPGIGQVAYATAKAALLGLTTSLAQQVGTHGIRVNAILPGFLETRMTAPVTAARKAEILADHTLSRLNTPVAVAKLIHFLHENLPHTSGQIFQLDSRIS